MAMDANQGELPQMELFRAKLAGFLAQALDVSQQQAVVEVSRQKKSKQLRHPLTGRQRLAHGVRTAVKEHSGIREEKVVEFGVQPFRGRKTKSALEAPRPPPAEPEQPIQPKQ